MSFDTLMKAIKLAADMMNNNIEVDNLQFFTDFTKMIFRHQIIKFHLLHHHHLHQDPRR